MPELSIDDKICLLHLGDDENRFTPGCIAEVAAALDEVASGDGPRALITVAAGKFWSNGLDLDWLRDHADELDRYVGSVRELFAKLLTLPVSSVAMLRAT